MAHENGERVEAYRLLSAIYLGKVDPEDVRTSGFFEAPVQEWLAGSEDDRAADHQALFGLNVLPYASVFLEPETSLGGAVSADLHRFREFALPRGSSQDPPDHISSELDVLADLSESPVSNREAILCKFIDVHILSWLPAFVRAVRAESDPFYSRVAGLTIEVVTAHRKQLTGVSEPMASDLPPAPALLEDPSTGLVEIAKFLTTPVWCGFYVSRSGIGRLSRVDKPSPGDKPSSGNKPSPGDRLPHGFGGRTQMMTTLFRSAAAYDGMTHVTSRLRSVLDENRDTWNDIANQGLSAASYWADQWIAKLDETDRMLQKLLDAATKADGSE